MDARGEEKRRQLERALQQGTVMIHLDARRPGVIVPARFRDDFHLRLNVSLRFDPPDLTVGEWGVRETLSFGGVRFAVAVPWSAIFAITGPGRAGQAWMYSEEMPRELFEEAARHFGLSGAEVDQLRDEAKLIGPAELRHGAEPNDPVARRRALQVVEVVSGEFEIPEEAGNESADSPAAPVASVAPAAPAAEPAIAPVPAAPAKVEEPEAPAPSGEEQSASEQGADDKSKRRGHLRLVK